MSQAKIEAIEKSLANEMIPEALKKDLRKELEELKKGKYVVRPKKSSSAPKQETTKAPAKARHKKPKKLSELKRWWKDNQGETIYIVGARGDLAESMERKIGVAQTQNFTTITEDNREVWNDWGKAGDAEFFDEYFSIQNGAFKYYYEKPSKADLEKSVQQPGDDYKKAPEMYLIVQTWNGEGYSEENKIVEVKPFDNVTQVINYVTELAKKEISGLKKNYGIAGGNYKINDDSGRFHYFKLKPEDYGVIIFTNVNDVKVLNYKDYTDALQLADRYYGANDFVFEDARNGENRYFFSSEDLDYKQLAGDTDESDYQFEVIPERFRVTGTQKKRTAKSQPKEKLGKVKSIPAIAGFSENTGNRPSPTQSASKVPVGTKAIGNSGHWYEVVENKNGVHRWVKLNYDPIRKDFSKEKKITPLKKREPKKTVTKLKVFPTAAGFEKYKTGLKKLGITMNNFHKEELTYTLPLEKALATAYAQVVLNRYSLDEYDKHLDKVKDYKSYLKNRTWKGIVLDDLVIREVGSPMPKSTTSAPKKETAKAPAKAKTTTKKPTRKTATEKREDFKLHRDKADAIRSILRDSKVIEMAKGPLREELSGESLEQRHIVRPKEVSGTAPLNALKELKKKSFIDAEQKKVIDLAIKREQNRLKGKNIIVLNGVEYDCDELADDELKRLKERKKDYKESKTKRPSTKNIDRVERTFTTIENSFEKRVESGKEISKTEIIKTIEKLESMLKVLKELKKGL
jgi:hypothetical protein